MNKSIIQQHLNNNEQVFVDVYNKQKLVQITNENINQFDVVDISDQYLEVDLINNHQDKQDYYKQQNELFNQNQHFDYMNNQFLKTYQIKKIYHIDSEADVYIV